MNNPRIVAAIADFETAAAVHARAEQRVEKAELEERQALDGLGRSRRALINAIEAG